MVSATVLRIAEVATAAAAGTTSGVTQEPAAYVSNSLCDTSFMFTNLSLCDMPFDSSLLRG